MVRPHRPARVGRGAVALLLAAACSSGPQLGLLQARAEISEELPELLHAAVGDRRSAPTELVALDCADGPGRRHAERHAQVAALNLDDDPDAIADAAQEHLEGKGADVTLVELLPQDPRVEAELDGIRYVVLVDTETRRIMAAGTTECYPAEEIRRR